MTLKTMEHKSLLYNETDLLDNKVMGKRNYFIQKIFKTFFILMIGIICGSYITNKMKWNKEKLKKYSFKKNSNLILTSNSNNNNNILCSLDHISPDRPPGTTWYLRLPDPKPKFKTMKQYDIIKKEKLPENWDWRNYNNTGISFITNIANQMLPKGCGSCWAFATTRALSDRIKIRHYFKYKKMIPTDVILSVQALLDCGHHSFGSCHGGDPRYAHEWIFENGLVDETCSLYIGSTPSLFLEGKKCGDNQCHTCTSDGNCYVVQDPEKYYIESYGSFHRKINNKSYDIIDMEERMMNEIYRNGPIVVAMYSKSKKFINYKGGYILQDSIIYNTTNHDVSIIGWGIQNNIKYWIVRNSYGTNWGENGFFRIERGNNTYNIEIQAAWANPKI